MNKPNISRPTLKLDEKFWREARTRLKFAEDFSVKKLEQKIRQMFDETNARFVYNEGSLYYIDPKDVKVKEVKREEWQK